MSDLPVIAYLCIFVGFATIGLALVNAIFWGQNRDSQAATPRRIRVAWLISLASLLVAYFALISLAILGYDRFFGAEKVQGPSNQALALLALVNSCWALLAGALFTIWLFWLL